MPIQIHTYLSPQDDPGEEAVDKAIWRCTTLNIHRQGDKLVAYPLGDVYKSRNKFRAGRGPEETNVDPIQRFAPSDGSSLTFSHGIELDLGQNVPDPIRQIEQKVLAKILAVPEQAGSVIVND